MTATRRLLCCLPILLICASVSGCNRIEEQPIPAEADALAPATERPGQGSPRQISNEPVATGIIYGSVRFIGDTIPTSTMVPVGTDPQHCGEEYSKEDYVIDIESRGIRHVIVRLTDERLKHWPHSKPGNLFLDNKDCRFEPHAAVLTVGSTLEVHNSDPLLHTVHAYFSASFNLALPRDGISLKRVLSNPGLIQLRCDVHGWMNSFIQVDWHPFHAVTDDQGNFEIAGVPSGAFMLEAWHEQFGTIKTEVIVQEKKPTEALLTYTDE